MATILTVTAKGQVTLRKDILEHLGVRPGDKLSVAKLSHGRIAVGADRPRSGKLADIAGILKRPNQPALTIDEMNEAIAKGWARER